MTLKHILFTSIAAVSLSGSLYGMDTDSSDIRLKDFAKAVKNCDEQIILHLLSRNDIKIDINAVNPHLDESTALDYAMEKWNPELVRILLQAGSNVNALGTHYLADAIKYASEDECLFEQGKEIIHLLCTAHIAIGNIDEYFNQINAIDNQEIRTILQNHINSRLLRAILYNSLNEIEDFIKTYHININQTLPFYREVCLISALPTKDLHLDSFIPLHVAITYKKNNVVNLLINTFNADVTIQDTFNHNAFHYQPDVKIVQLLIDKGCNPHIANNTGIKPIDLINESLNPQGLEKIRNKEQIQNLRALKNFYEGRPYLTTNNSPWKLIGRGAVVVVAAIAAKKLYNWWYTETDIVQEETSEVDAEHTDQQNKDTDKNKMATQV